MKLIIGGAYQGKCQYVNSEYHITKEELCDGATCDYKSMQTAKGVYNFHEYIKRMIEDGLDASSIVLEHISKNPQVIIICNELGCGLVPVEAFDRTYRETVGRILCELAKQADTVIRVYCGIGVKIKGL